MVETRNSKKIKEDQNPRKLYSRFIFKALILAVFCFIVPLFLSQTPELSNQTSLLELLHLVFVGIAVSYGLFSRRNYDNDHKTDHNSYVPKILEVPSSVFNLHHHESESEPSDDSSGDYAKIQTWKNNHHMKIPEIVLSKDDHFGEKPLLLPVRSLNHTLRVSDSGENSGRWEKVRSKRQLLKNLVDDDNSDVLPSPIPWRSRSSSSKEIESQPSIKNLTTVESKTPANLTSSSSSSPRKSTTLSAEDVSRRYNYHGEFHPPPLPPPPPPLPTFYNSASRKENPATSSSSFSSQRKSTTLPESGAKSAENIAGKLNFHGEFHPPPSPPPPPPPLPAFYRSKSRELAHKTKFGDGEFHPPPPPPPPPPVDYYKSPPTKLRASKKSSENKAKVDDRSSKRNNLKKVWWSDPIVESKEQETEKKSYLGNKEYENREEERNRDSENDEIKEKKIEEEGVCESNNGSDVDKKADEFIAKFREQIRLQRIESIKRSANKISSNASR